MAPGEMSLKEFDYNSMRYQDALSDGLDAVKMLCPEDHTTYDDTHRIVRFARALGMLPTELVVYFIPFIYDAGVTDHAYIAVVTNMDVRVDNSFIEGQLRRLYCNE